MPTVFVRISGCSLRCGQTQDGRKLWCDTPYALSPRKGEKLHFSEILAKIQSLCVDTFPQILITGGEPLEGENRNLTIELANSYPLICKNPRHPYPRIETNGAETLGGLKSMVFTMDYKLPGSGMEDRMIPENFQILNERQNPLDEIKFVVRDRLDFERSLEICKEYKVNTWILYSPVEGEMDPRELAEFVKRHPSPNARLSLQIHKVLWGNTRGV